MRSNRQAVIRLSVALGMLFNACARNDTGQSAASSAPATSTAAPVAQSLQMGGAKSVTRFFITSTGSGRGGDLGGLAGADALCQRLADAEKSGDHTWRAYLSTAATATTPAVNARDRIGRGPWYNAEGTLVAANLDELHGSNSKISKETAVTERLDPVNGVGDTPNMHDILTGSQPDGTAFRGGDDLTCGNWTSSGAGRAQVGHHDRKGLGDGVNSWNSVHPRAGAVSSNWRRPAAPAASTVSPSTDVRSSSRASRRRRA